MFLLTHILPILFLIDGAFPSSANGGSELENYQQTHLEINLIDQCMANPETGPQGRYHSAMRFKFLLNASRECNGSIWLCYPGQLDPDKTFGLSVPTTHWAIRNLRNNPIAKTCSKFRKNCQEFMGGDCEMRDTPWHGIQIKIGEDGRIEFNMSTGGSYKFPLTNFTLMLHNNGVNDEADPAAFLVNDHDNRDLCIKQDAFPIGGQSKPVVSKIPLHGNDGSYTKWKKRDNVGQHDRLRNHSHLFRLSWDMLPKTQLDQDDGKMYILMEHDVNETCNTRVFFLDRMQREAENFVICPNTAEVMKIPLSDECPGSGWKLIKAAHLADEYGSELVVRIGFLHANLYNKKEYKQQDEEEWVQLRTILSTSPMMVQRWPKSLEQFIKKFDLGDYRYASVQNDFDLSVSIDQQLEALVLNCSFGKMATLVRRVQGGFDPSKIPTEDEPIYDWSKDFDHVNQCKEKQHLLIRRTMEIEKARGNISLGVGGLRTGLLKHWIKQEATTEEEWRSASTIDLIAHKYKFHGRFNNNVTANNYARIKKFGRILSFGEDEYMFQIFTSIFAILNISKEMVENHKSSRPKTSEILIKKSCATKNYCNESDAREFCEEQNAVYECDANCTENNCNGNSSRSCIEATNNFPHATNNFPHDNNSRLHELHLIKYLTEGLVLNGTSRCEEGENACLTELCQNKNETKLIQKCAMSYHCSTGDSEKKQKECEDFRCDLCEEDNCNKCSQMFIFELNEEYNGLVQSELAGYGTKDLCIYDEICRTEICYFDGQMWVGKGCAKPDYCTSDASLKERHKCEVDRKGHYECKMCRGLNFCNGLPRQRCYSSGSPFKKNEGFFSVHDEDAPIGVKDTECPEYDMNFCATEVCKKPSEFIVFGLYVLEYQCPNISFFLPRFDGAILDGTEPENREQPRNWKGNLVQVFKIDHHYEEGDIKELVVDRDNLANYFYNLLDQEWTIPEVEV